MRARNKTTVLSRSLIGTTLAVFSLAPVSASAVSCDIVCNSASAAVVRSSLDPLGPAVTSFEDGRYDLSYARAMCVLKTGAATELKIRALQIAGRSAVRMGCQREARRRLQEAMNLSAHDERLHGASLIYLGEHYERQKQHDLALDHYERGQAALRREKDPDWRKINYALFRIGDIEVARGEFDSAIRHNRQGYDNAKVHGGPLEQAEALDYVGYAHRQLGDYDKAIEFHREALKLSLRLPGVDGARARGRARNHLALCLYLRGLHQIKSDRPRAMNAFLEATREAEAAVADLASKEWGGKTDLKRIGYLHRALSRIYSELARAHAADRERYLALSLQAAHQGVQVGSDMKDREWQGLGMHALADGLAEAGDYESARTTLQEAIRLWEELGDRYSQGYALRRLAVAVYKRRGEHDKAQAYLGRSIDVLSSIRMRDEVVLSLVELGRVYEDAGEFTRARSTYYRAIDVLEQTRARLTSDDNKIAFLSRRMAAYEALIALLSREFRENGSLRDGEEAFRISELARGRVLLDMVEKSNARIAARVDAVTLAEEQRLQKESERLREQLAVKALKPDMLARLNAQARAADTRLMDFYRSIARRYPDYVRLRRPVAASLRTVREQALQSGDVLIEFFIGENKTYVFVVKPEGLVAIQEFAITRAELTHDVTRFRAPLEQIKRLQRGKAGAFIVSSASFDLALGERLYQSLFAPLDRHVVGAARLIIVPDGPLFHLPFEALVKRRSVSPFRRHVGDLKNSTFLVDEAPPIAYAISASLLPQTRRLQALSRERRMAAFVNPITPLQPLKNIEPEVMQIGKTFASHKVYPQGEATRQSFVAEAHRFSAFHIATHGELNEAQPMRSGFWLTDGKTRTGTLVSAADILNLSLNARLFVLRACETGIGRIYSGEGVMGLSRALKYAGVEGMVLSLWMVDDEPSSRLMVLFYDELRQGPDIQALYEAKRKLRASQPDYLAHPFYWAAFTYWL